MKPITSIMVGLLASTALAAPAMAQIADTGDLPTPVDQPQDPNEIVVTGIRGSQARAIDIKRDATAIVDAISAEDIGKLPDVTVVDALQRIPGVQIRRDAGEGTNVNIRGLPQVVTLLNGEQYLSPGNLGTAQPNLNDVPAQLMNAIVVYKSEDLHNAQSGISGTIDLRTRRPFDMERGTTLSAQSEFSRGDYTRKTDALVSGLASWRNDDFGVLVSAVGSDSHLGNNYAGIGGGVFGNNDWGGSDANWIAPHGYELYRREVERKRFGISGAIQWKVGDGFTITGEVFHTEQVEHNRASGVNISNRWTGLGWTTPTQSTDTGLTGSNGQPWLDVDQYDLDVWWLNSFTVNRTLHEHSNNYNLQAEYDNGGPFKFSARAIKSNARLRSMNGQVQGDLSNWQGGGGHTFTLFRDPNDPTRGPFYPADIAAQYPASQYSNGIVGSRGGRYIDPNPLGYGTDPLIHLDLRGRDPVFSGWDNPVSGGLGTVPLSQYMANLDSYAVAAFSSEGNQENTSDLDVYRLDGSYEFQDEPLFGFLKRVDVGVRRGERSVEIRNFHLFSSFYGGNGATDAAGCSAQWKAIDVVMNQNQCQAGEMVPNAGYDASLPVAAEPGNCGEAINTPTCFQGYTVNRPTKLNTYNHVMYQTNWGGVVKGMPGMWVVDPHDFDDIKSFMVDVFGGADEVIVPGNTYDVDLSEDSAYFDGAIEWGKLTGDVGVKVINTKLTVKQNLTGDTRNYGDTNLDVGDVISRRSYIDVLPALNLSYNFTPNLRARFSFAKTMIPLDLGNYGGGLKINTADSQGVDPNDPDTANNAPLGVRQVTSANAGGNPELNPWRSNNYDVALEYYVGRASAFSVGLFKLDINSFVTTATIVDGRFPDQDGVIRRTVPVTRPIQGSGGSLEGLEAGAKIAFNDFIQTPFLRNFGLDANYTYSDSSQNSFDLSGEKVPFQDNSKHQINVVGWYQDDHLQVRVAWNHRTPRLRENSLVMDMNPDPDINDPRGIPIYQATTNYVDVNVTYNINDMLALYGNASNVFGERERYYFQFADGIQQFNSQNQFEPRYSAGMRFRF